MWHNWGTQTKPHQHGVDTLGLEHGCQWCTPSGRINYVTTGVWQNDEREKGNTRKNYNRDKTDIRVEQRSQNIKNIALDSNILVQYILSIDK